MFRVRTAKLDDLDQVLALAEHLNSVNLPYDARTLLTLLEQTDEACSSPHDQRGPGIFMLVGEDMSAGRLVGTAMIMASHGTVDDPHHCLQIDTEERYSSTLGLHFRHQTLRYRQSFTPHTELGGFVVDPAFRGHPSRISKSLGLARLLYIALHRARFHDELQAELLPPLESDGSSLLWEHLGRKFTGIGYAEADRLSRTNREFINALFPRDAIYASLLPDHVQALIGVVGPGARPVANLLRSIGFRYNENIDPFDGGPHFAAATDATHPARTHVIGPCSVTDDEPDAHPDGIIATTGRGHGFVAAPATVRFASSSVIVGRSVASALGVRDGDPVVGYRWPQREGGRP
jgi:arginine N-succinyltransferase